MIGVIPLLIFLAQPSINTFLYLALDFFNLFLRSGLGTTSDPCFFKLKFEFQVHPDQFFA